MSMTLELNKENMLKFFPSWEIPLSDKEIEDFLNCEYQEEYSDLFLERKKWPRDLPRKMWISKATKRYTTKKAVRQDIKEIGDQLEKWLAMKQQAPNETTEGFIEACMDDLFKQKEQLKNKLKYVGVKFKNNDLESAKQVLIEDFLTFNKAGFTKCLWHTEKTGSLHKITGKNKVYCFAGCGTKDVIDVVQQQNNCTLPEAIKIILNR